MSYSAFVSPERDIELKQALQGWLATLSGCRYQMESDPEYKHVVELTPDEVWDLESLLSMILHTLNGNKKRKPKKEQPTVTTYDWPKTLSAVQMNALSGPAPMPSQDRYDGFWAEAFV